MKIVFMGTPDFAVPALQRLIEHHNVVCVYTREPRKSGRGNILNKTPIHLIAEKNKIEVRTPSSLKSAEQQQAFADLNADIAIVAAYGLILPSPVLNAYPYGCLNIHASLLPRWRGAAPIERAIEAGDKQSGITIMKIAEGLDTGSMLAKGVIDINNDMTGGELHDKMSVLGGDLIIEVLADITKYKPQIQDEEKACYAAKIDKSECKINLMQPIDILYNKIRAFSPYHCLYFEYNDERFKIIRAEKANFEIKAGQLLTYDKSLILGCLDGALKITHIQRQGKRPMATEELLRGFRFDGNIFLL